MGTAGGTWAERRAALVRAIAGPSRTVQDVARMRAYWAKTPITLEQESPNVNWPVARRLFNCGPDGGR